MHLANLVAHAGEVDHSVQFIADRAGHFVALRHALNEALWNGRANEKCGEFEISHQRWLTPPRLRIVVGTLQRHYNFSTNSKGHKDEKLCEEMNEGQKSEDPESMTFPEAVNPSADE